LIVKSGPERAQIDALDAIERGGDPDADYITIRRALTNSRFKDRTKMRIRAAEALGAFVNLKSTNLLVKLARGDKDTLVAKAAAITLGRHRANRKKVIPFCVRQWDRAVKDVEKKDSKKALRGSRLGDAHRHALRGLTGVDFKNPKEARDWWHKNQKIVSQEELVK
jgi:HEAT repeat protein